MKLSTYLSVGGMIAILFGAEFLLAPAFALPQYGMPTEPHHLLQARYFGATLLTWGLITWLMREVRDDPALRALLQASAVGHVLGILISVWAVVAGLQSAMAWLSVLIYGLLLIGALYYLASPARRAAG
jgi:hypothetical protein